MTLDGYQKKYETLKASFETVDDQYKSLRNFVPALQSKIWHRRRAQLRKELKQVKAKIESWS